jgi:hypothetical protein
MSSIETPQMKTIDEFRYYWTVLRNRRRPPCDRADF